MDKNIKKHIPKVSILMCTYNRASYLPEAIESVIAQSFHDYELIVIDDASTDNTDKVMSGYKKYERIKYFRNDRNLGLGGNRVVALSEARGEYVAILDSDDYWNDTEKLASQVAFLDKNPKIGIVGTFGTIVDDTGNIISTMEYETEDKKIRSRILSHHQFLHSSVLYRRGVAVSVGGYRAETAPAEDFELIVSMGQNCGFANLPSFSTCYRTHTKNSSSQTREKRVRHAILHLQVIQTSGKDYPNHMRALIKAYLRIAKNYLGL